MTATVALKTIIEEHKLETIYMPEGREETLIYVAEVNRPSLQIAGFFDYFDPRRIQIIGKVEYTYLEKMSSEERRASLSRLFSEPIPAVIVTRGLDIYDEISECALEHGVPVLRSEASTSSFMSQLILALNVALAPLTTIHGVLVEVYGEGLLIMGESGVGKSETAMELVKRGHRLVADDAVEIRRVSHKTLVGSSPEIIRHFIELRGIGVIDVKRIFGMGAVKDTENIDMVIQLEVWQTGKHYDRLGIDSFTTELLGLSVPSVTIPVKPGRNLAIICEVAAMNNRQRRMGYNAAEELNKRLMEQMGE